MMYNLPKLTDDKSFENLCCDIMKTMSLFGFFIYGRNGQKQQGIDIYPTSPMLPYIQCKNYQGNDKKSKDKFINEIRNDYNNATSHFSDCERFIVFTSLSRDVNLVNQILFIRKDNIPIIPYFWEDITKEIIKHPDLLRIYFPFYLNQENFKFIQGEEEKFIIDIKKIIKNNLNIIQRINLFSSKSSDFYDANDLLEILDARCRQYSLEATQSTSYVINFINILNKLVQIMAIVSDPDYYNPDIRIVKPFISPDTINDFDNSKKQAEQFINCILNLPTNE